MDLPFQNLLLIPHHKKHFTLFKQLCKRLDTNFLTDILKYLKITPEKYIQCVPPHPHALVLFRGIYVQMDDHLGVTVVQC